MLFFYSLQQFIIQLYCIAGSFWANLLCITEVTSRIRIYIFVISPNPNNCPHKQFLGAQKIN